MNELRPPARLANVSIAMATYNGERYIREQLESISQQTMVPTELVICDDLSTDRTLEIVRDFSASSKFPVHVHENRSRLHYADNFMLAASLCSGKYVAFCDQDDIWLPQKLEKSVRSLESAGAVLATHSYRAITSDGKAIDGAETFRRNETTTGSRLDPWDCFAGHSCVFDRTILDILPSHDRPIDLIHPERLSAHDRWIYFLAIIAGKIVSQSEILVLYRQHDQNVYGNRKIGLFYRLAKARSSYVTYITTRAAIARRNCLLLEAVRVSGSFGDNVRSELTRWTQIKNEYDRRSVIFDQKSILSKIKILILCLFSGTYGSQIGKIWFKAPIEDLIAIFVAQSKLVVEQRVT